MGLCLVINSLLSHFLYIDIFGGCNMVNCLKILGISETAEREKNDYYATDPKAMYKLLEFETFDKNIWEPACGEGNLSEVLKEKGYNVYSTDLINRGYGDDHLIF